MFHIPIISCDKRLENLLNQQQVIEGTVFITVSSGKVLAYVQKNPVPLVIADLFYGEKSSCIEVTHEILEHSSFSSIILYRYCEKSLSIPGAVLDLSSDKVHYCYYPFSIKKLLETIYRLCIAHVSHQDCYIHIGPYKFSAVRQLLIHPNEVFQLTEKETQIIVCLCQHYPLPVTKQVLQQDVWQHTDAIDSHTVETHMYRLRKKIG